MKDLTPLLHLMALHMRERRFWERRELAGLGDYDAYLAVRRTTERIDYLASFIRSFSTHNPH